jgi:hypothetical protein
MRPKCSAARDGRQWPVGAPGAGTDPGAAWDGSRAAAAPPGLKAAAPALAPTVPRNRLRLNRRSR